MPPDVEELTPEERAKYVIEHPELAENLVAVILADKTTADLVGKDVADVTH